MVVSNVGAIGAGNFAFSVLVPGGKLAKVEINWSGITCIVEGAELDM